MDRAIDFITKYWWACLIAALVLFVTFIAGEADTFRGWLDTPLSQMKIGDLLVLGIILSFIIKD